MKADEALRELIAAQGDMITALHTMVTSQSKRIDSLMVSIESLSRWNEAQSEVVGALQASYDEKFALISERLLAMAADDNE
jgi:hypothetical protein